MGDWAVMYASRGLHVIPLHDVSTGACSCGAGLHDAAAKHPRISNWSEEASSDVEKVAGWWRLWPNANVGWAVGRDGMVVIDCDTKDTEHGGVFEVEQYLAGRNEDLLPTLTAKTGSGGRHLVFRLPEGVTVGNRARVLPDVDVRGVGGQVVLPPSLHRSGSRYEWVDGFDVRKTSELPSALLALVQGKQSTARRSTSGGSDRRGAADTSYRRVKRSGDGPPNGARDDFFNARAFELRKVGVSLEAALVELRQRWETSDQPSNDPYPWDAVVEKAQRIWADESITPDAPVDPNSWQPNFQWLTDDGNARLFVSQHKEEVRYAVDSKDWFAWDDTRWAPGAAETLVLRRARETARSLANLAATVDDDDDRDRALAHARSSLSASRINAIPGLARSDQRVAVKVSDFDADPWLLNTPSGTVDLRTGELREHRREDMLSKITTTPYDPTAQAPHWRAWVDWAMGDRPDVAEFLQRATGYALTGAVSEQVFFLMYGTGANGKSTYLNVIESILGDYAMHAEPDLLAPSRGAHPTGQAALFGKRFVTAVETREGQALDPRVVKQLTGGDTVTARRMYKDFFEFRPTHTIFFSVNHMPIVTDTSAGMWRRVRVVPFDRRVDPASKVDDYDQWVVAAEGPGILRWAVEGAVKWYRDRTSDGLRTPAAVQLHTAEYEHDQNDLADFFDDCIVVDADGFVESRVLYDRYATWCTWNAVSEKLGKTMFLARVMDAFPTASRGQRAVGGRNPRGVVGIRLHEESTL